MFVSLSFDRKGFSWRKAEDGWVPIFATCDSVSGGQPLRWLKDLLFHAVALELALLEFTMRSATRIVLLSFSLMHVALATTFHPNCTVPPPGSNYVAGPNVRSSLDIFWSALYTIFVCTWAVQHLNVPAQEPEPPKRPKFEWHHFWRSVGHQVVSWRASLGTFWRTFWRKMKWLLVTIMLPEYLVGRALGDYTAAHKFEKEMDSVSDAWTATHGFYANSGGFVLELNTQRFTINSVQLRKLVARGCIDSEPPIGEAEIMEKGRGDFFATLMAMLQLLWVAVQLISRKILDLPSTKLEITALSFALCSLLTYALWFGKPKDVQIPTYISLDCRRDGPVDHGAPDIHIARELKPALLEDTGGSFFRVTLLLDKLQYGEDKLDRTIPNDHFSRDSLLRKHNSWALTGLHRDDIGFIIGAVILGACHCIAWNFEYPTPIERTLWRVATVIITTLMPLFYLSMGGLQALLELHHPQFRETASAWAIFMVLAWVPFIIYGLARLYLLGAAIRDLFYLAPEAYITTWSVVFPHFG
jgi:hypothetical protein